MAVIWEEIPTSEITVDADINAETMFKYRTRQNYLKEVVEGAPAQDRIPGQAIEQQAAGSGTGLEVTQFNHVTASGSVAFANPDSIKVVDTGLTLTASKTFFPTLTGTTGVYDFYMRGAALTTGNYGIEIQRSGTGSASTVNWTVYVVAN